MDLDRKARRLNYKSNTTRLILKRIYFLLILQSLTLKEAQVLALKVLKQVMEEKLSPMNVQLACVTAEHGFKILGEAEIKAIVDELA